MENADDWRDAEPWHPITTAIDLKFLGKLGEELGECSSAVSRCIIQGMDEREPITRKLNRDWLTEEIADVLANISLCIDFFQLDPVRISERSERKQKHLRQRHEQA